MNTSFYSDNCSWTNNEIINSLKRINKWYDQSYWNDKISININEILKDYFWRNIFPYFTLSWTLANVFILNQLTKKWKNVLCTDIAHILKYEKTVHDFFSEINFITIKNNNWKLNIYDIENFYKNNKNINVISLTNPTEYWTVYSKEEISKICKFAHKNNIYVHMDWARISNASIFLNLHPKEISFDLWIDALYYWWTKNWIMYWEFAIYNNSFNKEEIENDYERFGIEYSKTRFFSIQYETYINKWLWEKNAKHSNKMAKYFELKISKINWITITKPVESNVVFIKFKNAKLINKFKKSYQILNNKQDKDEARIMFSFNISKKEVNDLINAIKIIIKKS
jgi:threonine aldolase